MRRGREEVRGEWLKVRDENDFGFGPFLQRPNQRISPALRNIDNSVQGLVSDAGLVCDASQVFEAILVTMVTLLSGPIESK